ncbi:hypothetical protein L6452_35014 [Arctium lappa]|uniref:Uncharacterized protein n=1 Tax=Arctium lappa TaxID=4217 RepID=A0ACB8YKI5_ARCLA|nr:hypothetical protein L6452_35014 [Arctium lappa]
MGPNTHFKSLCFWFKFKGHNQIINGGAFFTVVLPCDLCFNGRTPPVAVGGYRRCWEGCFCNFISLCNFDTVCLCSSSSPVLVFINSVLDHLFFLKVNYKFGLCVASVQVLQKAFGC